LSTFVACKAKIGNESRVLFPPGAPRLDGIKQGKTGDCYFISVVGALANSRPDDIVKMIRELPDGSYIVKFPAAPPEPVAAPTDAEIAAFSDAGSGGFWLHVLEKAFTQLVTRSLHQRMVEPMDFVVYHGGSPAKVMRLLTGHEVIRVHLHKGSHPHLREAILSALRENRLVGASVPGHALAIVNCNPENDTVEIWNPWGSDVYYNKVGEFMHDGIFDMNFSRFMQIFSSVCIEQH
jgi:hypothetical protein